MIKFLGQRDGRPLLGLGLSERNVVQLKEGKPIVVELQPLTGEDGQIVLLYGETEAAIVAALKAEGSVDEHTEVRQSPRSNDTDYVDPHTN